MSDPFGANPTDVKAMEIRLAMETQKTERTRRRWDTQNIASIALTTSWTVLAVVTLLWLLLGVVAHEPPPEVLYEKCVSKINTDDQQTRLTETKACERILQER